MKAVIAFVVATGIVVAATATPANAAGCLSGAVVGGVAGHYAGHHGLLGAAAGCAVGHHMAKVDKERARERSAYERGLQDGAAPQRENHGF
jgi:hypothetical protein